MNHLKNSYVIERIRIELSSKGAQALGNLIDRRIALTNFSTASYGEVLTAVTKMANSPHAVALFQKDDLRTRFELRSLILEIIRYTGGSLATPGIIYTRHIPREIRNILDNAKSF